VAPASITAGAQQLQAVNAAGAVSTFEDGPHPRQAAPSWSTSVGVTWTERRSSPAPTNDPWEAPRPLFAFGPGLKPRNAWVGAVHRAARRPEYHPGKHAKGETTWPTGATLATAQTARTLLGRPVCAAGGGAVAGAQGVERTSARETLPVRQRRSLSDAVSSHDVSSQVLTRHAAGVVAPHARRETRRAIVCGTSGLAMQLARLLVDINWPVRVLAQGMPTSKVEELESLRVEVTTDIDYRVFPWPQAAGLRSALAVALVDENDSANIQTAFDIAHQLGGPDRCMPIAVRVTNDAVGRLLEDTLPHCTALSVSAIGARAFVQRALSDNRHWPRGWIPGLANPSDTVTYVRDHALVFRERKRLRVRRKQLVQVTFENAKAAIRSSGERPADFELVDAGLAKRWQGRAHWTWLAWMRWHLRRRLGAPATLAAKILAHPRTVFYGAGLLIILMVSYLEGRIQGKHLWQVFPFPSVIIMFGGIVSEARTLALPGRRIRLDRLRRAFASRWGQLVKSKTWRWIGLDRLRPALASLWDWLLRSQTLKRTFIKLVTLLVLLVAFATTWRLLLRAPTTLVAIGTAGIGFGVISHEGRFHSTPMRWLLALVGLPLLVAALVQWWHPSIAVTAITGAVVAGVVEMTRFGNDIRRWFDERGSPALVFGVGSVGSQIIRRLVDQGMKVAAADRDAKCPHAAAMRRLGVAVEVGYDSIEQVIENMRVHRCQLVFAVTDDDIANLECGLRIVEMLEEKGPEPSGSSRVSAKASTCAIHVRAFQPKLGEKLTADGRWDLKPVSRLVATTFARALVGQKIYGRLELRDPAGDPRSSPEIWMIGEIAVDSDSPLCGTAVKDRLLAVTINRAQYAVLKVIRSGWPQVEDDHASPQAPLKEHDRLVVLGSREALDTVRSQAGRTSNKGARQLLQGISSAEDTWIDQPTLNTLWPVRGVPVVS